MNLFRGRQKGEADDAGYDRAIGIAARPRDTDERSSRPNGAGVQRYGADARCGLATWNRERCDDTLAGKVPLVAGQVQGDGEKPRNF